MRFLCAYKILDEAGKLKLKTEVHTTKVDDVQKGQLQLLVKLSTDYDIPAEFVKREDNIPGILYINPKQEYKKDTLGEIDMEEWEAKEYDRFSIE